PATNVAYRYPVLWGLHPADALSRPKWKRVVDGWFERATLRPPLLPHGIECSPVIPAHQPNERASADAGFGILSAFARHWPGPLSTIAGQWCRYWAFLYEMVHRWRLGLDSGRVARLALPVSTTLGI